MLRKSIFTAVAALAVIMGAPPSAAWADSEQLSVEELTQQVEAMQAQMAVLMQRLEAMQQEGEDLREETTVLTEDMEDMDDRMMVAERHAVLDKVRFSGDFRTQVHSIQGSMIDRIDGIWTPGKILAIDHRTGHRTELTFRNVEYTAGFDASLFDARLLGRGLDGIAVGARLRGVRLGVMMPDVNKMQVRAIFEEAQHG